jgi:hypothetical protein
VTHCFIRITSEALVEFTNQMSGMVHDLLFVSAPNRYSVL